MNDVDIGLIFFELLMAWKWPVIILVLLRAYQQRHKALDTIYKTRFGKWLIDKWISSFQPEYKFDQRYRNSKEKRRRKKR